ncbi:MAG: NAD-binding protein, partial [Synergistaceae bacterium]|nr:NAD-binding protein [Synergistaceae bacterium]
MNVCVVGLGYIGLPLAAVLAGFGHRVQGVDRDREIVDNLRSGKLSNTEPA